MLQCICRKRLCCHPLLVGPLVLGSDLVVLAVVVVVCVCVCVYVYVSGSNLRVARSKCPGLSAARSKWTRRGQGWPSRASIHIRRDVHIYGKIWYAGVCLACLLNMHLKSISPTYGHRLPSPQYGHSLSGLPSEMSCSPTYVHLF